MYQVLQMIPAKQGLHINIGASKLGCQIEVSLCHVLIIEMCMKIYKDMQY